MDSAATLPSIKNKGMDTKYLKHIDAIQREERKYMDNTVFQIYLLNILSKRIMEWRNTLETWRKTKQFNDLKHNNKVNNDYYKFRVKELLFKNELLRESIMRTKKNDFLCRNVPQNDNKYKRQKDNDDAKFKSIAFCIKNKVDDINKYHQKHQINGENALNNIRLDINRLYEQIDIYKKTDNINNKNEMKNELILGERHDFEYILEPLLRRSFSIKNVNSMWLNDFINYIKFGDVKDCLSSDYKCKLRVLSRAESVDKNKIKKLNDLKETDKKWKQRFDRIFGDEYKDIVMKKKDFSGSGVEFYDNRALFRDIALKNKDKNVGNHNKMICNHNKIEYDEYSDDDDCFIDSDGLSLYSYQYSGNSLSECTEESECAEEISPIYRNIEWERNEFIAKNTNVPHLKGLRSHKRSHKRRNKKEIEDVPPLVEDPNDGEEKENEYDLIKAEASATDNIPYLGQIPPQLTSPQPTIKVKKDINSEINNMSKRFLNNIVKLRRDNEEHSTQRLTAQRLTYIPNTDSNLLPQLNIEPNKSKQHNVEIPQFDADTALILQNESNKERISKCPQCHVTQNHFNTKREFIMHQTHCNIRKKESYLNEMGSLTLPGMTNSLIWRFNDLYWKKPYNPMLYKMQNVLNGNKTSFALKNAHFIPSKHCEMNDNHRLWFIANSTISPNPTQFIQESDSESIRIMLEKDLPTEAFPVCTLPLSLKPNKAERCAIYKNFEKDSQITAPSDAKRDDINNAKYFKQKKMNQLTYNEWIKHYKNYYKQPPPPPKKYNKNIMRPPPPTKPHPKYQSF